MEARVGCLPHNRFLCWRLLDQRLDTTSSRNRCTQPTTFVIVQNTIGTGLVCSILCTSYRRYATRSNTWQECRPECQCLGNRGQESRIECWKRSWHQCGKACPSTKSVRNIHSDDCESEEQSQGVRPSLYNSSCSMSLPFYQVHI